MNQVFDRMIRNGKVVLPGGTYKRDIGIIDGKIAAISPSLADSAADEVLDAEGQYVLPGMIDIHVHFNEPNFGHWEGFATGSAALAAGGCTTYVDMPLNGNPPTVTPEALALKGNLAVGNSSVDYAFWGGLVPGKLDQLEKMAALGVRGFKAFMSNPGGEGEGRFREVDDLTLYEGMQRIAALGGFVALHAESDAITSQLAERAIREGRTDARAFVASRPVIAELEAVNKAILFSEQTGCEVHFVHISSTQAIELIDQAKKRGVKVTVETCPHYLVLTDEDMANIGPAAKCAPPLRSAEQQDGLWRLIAEGKLDVIASDHSPCPPELKFSEELTFFEAWGGIAGAQNSLELVFDEGYIKRHIPLHQLVELLSAGPAKRFGLYPQKGAIAEGADADLVFVDASHSYTLTEEHLQQRHKISPYLGREFACKVTTTLVRGLTVYTEEQGVHPASQGQLLLKSVNAPQQTP
ncbi:allantoinase [Paenibacillus glycanilyticus]|uniref:Allantoinase n=1 Tax=Paenibacillus glycanilyticus TaxID=126569 RepID=A0ABQ6GKH2_9BACL|nr:allantoinase [Paenibacillus glycanilyticus]GLX70733.1 allantoinase [Paenibacillus glycanilyticus]